jgi:hypothetical protein
MSDSNKKINFSLLKIKTEQFAVFEDDFDKREVINLKTNLTFGLNVEDKVFAVTPKYTFENNGKPFIALQISCFFKIDNITWKGFTDKKQIIFPKEFTAHIAMITVGTSRGILHTKTEGTPFNEYLLPPLNVAEMIGEDLVFDI